MSFESTRSTKAAVVEETTEGTPVAPSSGSDYVALQDGFAITPAFNTLENAEISGTTAAAAPVQGLETPTASNSHYLRHSGVEGQLPNYNLYLKSLFGTVSSNATERTTTAGSTAGDSTANAIIKLAAGGTDFARGKAVLLKDGTNGYSVRNVLSVATNDLTSAFNLTTAPGSGVNCGKCINYDFNDDGVPLTLWNYLGNGGAIEMVSGAKVDSATVNIPAGEFINTDYSFACSGYYFNPIEITAANDAIDFTDSTGAVTGNVTNKMYNNPHELAAAVGTAMTGASAGSAADTITCTYSNSTGKFTVETDGTVLTIAWTTAGHIGATLGFTADDSGSTTYASDDAQSWASPYTPSLDTESPLVAKNTELFVGSATDFSCLQGSSVTVNFGKEASDVTDFCSESGKAATVFNGRTVTVDISGYLKRHDVSKWYAFKNNDTVQFAYTAGRKSGDNWVAGSVINLFSPTAKISNFAIEDLDGVFALNFTVTCFASSGLNEFYMNLL